MRLPQEIHYPQLIFRRRPREDDRSWFPEYLHQLDVGDPLQLFAWDHGDGDAVLEPYALSYRFRGETVIAGDHDDFYLRFVGRLHRSRDFFPRRIDDAHASEIDEVVLHIVPFPLRVVFIQRLIRYREIPHSVIG